MDDFTKIRNTEKVFLLSKNPITQSDLRNDLGLSSKYTPLVSNQIIDLEKQAPLERGNHVKLCYSGYWSEILEVLVFLIIL